MPQKDTSKLVQSNLMNMFNNVAHTATGKSIKPVIKASKGNRALDKTEETLPPLLHDGSESEEEIPMKPPATSSNAPDPNDDWDTYMEETTMKGRGKKRKQCKTENKKKRNKTKQAEMETEGWLDLDISEANLDLSGNVEMEDATIPEMETDKPTPRKSKFKKGFSKADRKYIHQQWKAGSEMLDKDLIAERAKLKAELLAMQEAAQAGSEKKKAARDDDSIMTDVTADTTVASASTQEDSITEETDAQAPGTPKCRGAGTAQRTTKRGGRGGRGGRGMSGRGGNLGRCGLDSSLSQAAAAQAADNDLLPPVPPGPQANPYQQPPPPTVNQMLMNRDNVREHAEFTQIVINVPKSPQSSLALWKAAVTAFTAIKAAVPSAILLLANQRGNDPKGAISDPNQLPRQLTLLEDYFPSLKPKPEGGKSYARCHIGYNGEKESFWQDAKASLKNAKADMYQSKLPEEPYVVEGVMIKNSYPCMNVDEWGPFLKKLMDELSESEGGRQSEVVVAFNDKPLMDGNKRDRSNKRSMRMQRAVYMESPRGSETRNAYLLNKVLKGEAVASRCRIPLCLMSKFNRWASVNVRKQVTKAHRQHCQLRSSITDVTIDNINDIDTQLSVINNRTI